MQIISVPGQSPQDGDSMTDDISTRFRIETEPIGPETKLVAERELRENEDRVKESIEKLRTLLRAQEKLYFDDSDDFLQIFLRPTKYYPESALELMKRVADFKDKHSDILRNLTVDSERRSLVENEVVNVLVDRDHKGRRVLLVNVGSSWDVKKVSSDQLFRLFYLVHLGAMLEPETQVRGVVVILDFEGLGMSQAKAMDISFSRRLLNFIQFAMPLRLKEVHIVRQPFVFSIVWAVFQNFVEKKLSSRLFKHGTKFESLHKHIDPAYLPKDFGGSLPAISYSSKEWYPVLDSIGDHIKDWQNYGNVKKDK